jgi:hypothetical protein
MVLPRLAQAALLDDRFHFSDYDPSNTNISEYCEWWFFNLYQQDIQAVIQYSLWDPAQTPGNPYSLGMTYVSIHRNNAALDILFPITWESIVTSESDASLTIETEMFGPERIVVNTDGSYSISGGVTDGNYIVTWDLTYEQQLGSLNVNTIEISETEEMNWYAQMPSAIVSGTITVTVIGENIGETIEIGGRGYHDHNWGPWRLTDTLWNWFETNTPEWAIVGYDFFALNTGQITVELEGQTIQFEKNQYSIINYCWKTLPGLPFIEFPTKTTVIANNGESILLLNVATGATGYVTKPEIGTGYAWIVFESDATFKGELIGNGEAKQMASVGFREYTVKIPYP